MTRAKIVWNVLPTTPKDWQFLSIIHIIVGRSIVHFSMMASSTKTIYPKNNHHLQMFMLLLLFSQDSNASKFKQQ
jgi:hypothetical protein